MVEPLRLYSVSLLARWHVGTLDVGTMVTRYLLNYNGSAMLIFWLWKCSAKPAYVTKEMVQSASTRHKLPKFEGARSSTDVTGEVDDKLDKFYWNSL